MRTVTAVSPIALLAAACGRAAAAPTWSFAPSATTPPAVAAAAALPPSPAPSAPTPAPAPVSASVRIANFAFGPELTTIGEGGRVNWTNEDGDRHSILLAGSESPRLEAGATYSRTFEAPGRFAYVCGIHSSMSGTIVVVGGPPAAGSSVSGTAGDPTPAGTLAPSASTDGDDGGDDREDDRDDHDRDDHDHSGHGGGGDDDDRSGDDDHSGTGGGGSGDS